MRRVGRATTTTAKTGWRRSDSRLCVEDRRTEPGNCVHQTEVLFWRRSSGTLGLCNYRAAVYLSQLMAAAGQAEQALALRRAASSWNDANATKYFGGARRLRARVLLLDGKPDAALAELAESFRSGTTLYWWYTIELRSLVVAAPRRHAIPGRSKPTCGGISMRSAANLKRCADTGLCRGARARPLRIEQQQRQ